ncbi:septum formation initiator family protein [Terrarubrum flagellatum]|uniref:FtsB family cell division protein n=1 Tax=Terrirubrum flagellatum TaxID=2895980 RepID=UPI003144D4B4
MVVRKGFRAFLIPVALYGVAFAVVGFFVTQAEQGQRGLEAKRELSEQEKKITAELDGLRAERETWERKVAMFRADALDKDLLDERVRRVLNRVHRHDVVIFTR